MSYLSRLIPNNSIGRRVVGGFSWLLLGAVISRGLYLLSLYFVARILGKEVFGEFGVIQSTFFTMQLLAGFGLGTTATKYVAEYRQKDPEKAGRIIGLAGITATSSGALMSAGLYLIAPWLCANTLGAPHLSEPLRWSGIAVFLGAINGVQVGVLSGLEAFKRITRVQLSYRIDYFPNNYRRCVQVWVTWCSVDANIICGVGAAFFPGCGEEGNSAAWLENYLCRLFQGIECIVEF